MARGFEDRRNLTVRCKACQDVGLLRKNPVVIGWKRRPDLDDHGAFGWEDAKGNTHVILSQDIEVVCKCRRRKKEVEEVYNGR